MLRIRLREAIDDYSRRSGQRMTYERLAQATGLSRATLESLASRTTYNTRLSTIDRLCRALDCQPADLFEFTPENRPNVAQD